MVLIEIVIVIVIVIVILLTLTQNLIQYIEMMNILMIPWTELKAMLKD